MVHAPTPTHTRIQPINPVSLHPNDVFSSRWTTPDISIWTRVAKDPQPFNLYMFRGNNPISKVHHIKEYVTGGLFQQFFQQTQILLRWATHPAGSPPMGAAGPGDVAGRVLNQRSEQLEELSTQIFTHAS